MTHPDHPKYSVVIPVYNSADIVQTTVETVVNFFADNDLELELLLINDGSTDGSWKVISELAEKHPNVVSIDLLKNYGQHSAVYCGIKNASGDYVITMDDDMQNPPSECIHLINKIKEGYDAVFAEFPKKEHASYRKMGTKVIDYLNRKVFGKPRSLRLTNFRIFNRDVANRISDYHTAFPYIPGLVMLSSSTMGNVLCQHKPRAVGKSNYNMWRIAKLTARILFNYSSFPLKLLTVIGVAISVASFVSGIFFLVKNLLVGSQVQGWTTLVVLLSFIGGFIIIMLGMIGEYLSRILNQLSTTESYQINKIVR